MDKVFNSGSKMRIDSTRREHMLFLYKVPITAECWGGPLDGKTITSVGGAFAWPFGWYYYRVLVKLIDGKLIAEDCGKWEWKCDRRTFLAQDLTNVFKVAKDNGIKVPLKFEDWKGWYGSNK